MKKYNHIYPLPFADFKRICSVIYPIVKNEGGDLKNSCVFINIAAALILNEHYNINARVLAGAALYKLANSDNTVLSLLDKNDEFVTGSESGFHCWIDTGEWIIDFTAPLFPIMLKSTGCPTICESKMFQKKYEQMTDSPYNLAKAGDFFIHSNSNLTRSIVDNFFSLPANIDLLKIICRWYIKPPKKIKNSITITDQNSKPHTINLMNINLAGAW